MSKQEKQSLPHVVWDRLFAIVIDYVLFTSSLILLPERR